ncbi:hypothetical protein C8R32_10859 [Nitrosospira sp. Nsp5]|uniref:Uncharacterized protein n=1 Tax=Nitrosospira multiformis TaxID=1231 RepID=A0ABY0T882_9PROT|nr:MULTISPECIES: hypothetical protein [Nitrosospira]PTR07103.1 hypothetical protein C8R32_10859 [Nitrosospira sp. Nsp5]SDQ33609.1 hypothetical protein SAMN05216402_0437 [Nitrosospira multiformis]
MSFPEVFSILKDILVGIAAATTAVVAVKGLRSWSRELKGKAEFEAARGLALATYKLRDSLRDCRSPLYLVSELADYNPAAWSGPNQEEADQFAYIYENRFAPVLTAVQQFDSYVLEAEALWGSKIKSKTDQLRACVQELNSAMAADIANKRSQGEDFKSDRDFAKQTKEKVTYLPDDETNVFSKRVRNAVEQIEGQLLPHLRRNN